MAELLSSVLPYQAGAGAGVAWLVLSENTQLFAVTKQLHNLLHGQGSESGPLRPGARQIYDSALADEVAQLQASIRAGDVAVLHDPQTAGLIPALKQVGAQVIWRCHIGADDVDDGVRAAQELLLDDVRQADLCVFSRQAHSWPQLDPQRTAIIQPCIDITSSKNRPLGARAVAAALTEAGLLAEARPSSAADIPEPESRAHVRHRAAMTEDEPIPPDGRLVVQVSRWDRLKDPVGLIKAFAAHGPPQHDVHLCVAGPSTDGVSDDPEAAQVLARARRAWSALPPPARRRVHLAELPMEDPDENALIVNALQQRAEVVVQKSLAEGFGLTVAEAMWKARPVVASRVGGIQDQIVHGVSGLLIDDPTDLVASGRMISAALVDRAAAAELGSAARERVCEHFLPANHIDAEVAAFKRVAAAVA